MTRLLSWLPRARWPWVLGTTLSILVLWRLEEHRAASPPSAPDESGPTARQPWSAQKAARSRARAKLRPVVRRWLAPARPGHVRVSGRVYDVLTGDPVPGVEVVLAGASETVERTDADGSYMLEVRPGRYRAFVRGSGVLSIGKLPREQQRWRPQLTPAVGGTTLRAPLLDAYADVIGADLDVVRAAIVHGTVERPDGRPIADALVEAVLEEDPTTRPVLGTDVARTDRDGRFELVIPARPHQLTAYHDDYVAAERPVVLFDAGQTYEPVLPMTAGCIVTGTVTGPGAAGGGRIARTPSVETIAGSVTVATFDEGGRFRWSTSETVSFALLAVPWKGPITKAQLVECRPGARPSLVFELPAETPALAGTVVMADGTPVAGALLDFSGVEPTWSAHAGRGRTDADGAWAAHGYPEGSEIDVVARVPGRGLATARVRVPSTDVTLTMSGTGALAGATTGLRDGTFVLEATCARARTYPTGADTADRFLVAVHDGRYQVDGVPACETTVVARNSLWQTKAQTRRVVAGQTTNLDLDLTMLIDKRVHGTVRDARGAPVAFASIVALDQPGLRTDTSADGEFTIRGAPGARLMISGDGVSQIHQLAADDVADVELDVVLDPTAAPR